jgi:hypothetical protein
MRKNNFDKKSKSFQNGGRQRVGVESGVPDLEFATPSTPNQKVSTYGNILVRAVARSFVEANDGALVIAEACSFIEARRGSHIIAYDGCVIFNYGGARIERMPGARVMIVDKLSLSAHSMRIRIASKDDAFASNHEVLVVLEGVHVKTGNYSHVLAFSDTIVETGSHCRIITADSCVVKTGKECTINTGNQCRVYRGDDCRVTVGDKCSVTMASVSEMSKEQLRLIFGSDEHSSLQRSRKTPDERPSTIAIAEHMNLAAEKRDAANLD